MKRIYRYLRSKIRLPYLDLWFDIWIIEINTDLFLERWETGCFEYIRLRIRFFKRWGFDFRLYSPRGKY